jgi:diguanylate cyclase (GGDEF)-like protein
MSTCRQEASSLCLAIVDIDNFKMFNDTYGHKAGDFVLAETARILEDSRRGSGEDQAFRYGGEEFCMLLSETDVATAVARMEAFRTAVEEAEHVWQGQTLRVTCSVGICHFPSGAQNSRDLFERADAALYAAKQAGRNQVCVAKAEDRVEAPMLPSSDSIEAASGHTGELSDPMPSEPPMALDLAALAALRSSGSDVLSEGFAPLKTAMIEDESEMIYPGELAANNLLPFDEDDPLAAMMS